MRVALIPARGGSKRIPRKNIRLFAGRPVIAWSLAAARDSGLFDRIICSTDDDEIAAVVERWGGEVPFRRPAELSGDFTPTMAVVAHALDWLEGEGEPVDSFCCIYAAAPFVTPALLRRGHELLGSSEAGYCVPVVRFGAPVQRALRVGDDGAIAMLDPAQFGTRSQDLVPAFHDAGQFFWGLPSAIRSGSAVLGPAAVALEIPSSQAVDIDTEEDWDSAEQMWMLRAAAAATGVTSRPGAAPVSGEHAGEAEADPPAGAEHGFNVLITSVSDKLSCIREVRSALRRLVAHGQVHGADLDPGCLGRDFVDEFWEMPPLAELSIGELIDHCRVNAIRLVVPTRDGELSFFATHREALSAAGICVTVSAPETVELCLDKLRFAEELERQGFPVIPAFESPGAAGERVVAKERFGAGSLGVRLDISTAAAAAARGEFSSPIFQPFIVGNEYSVDVFAAAGGDVVGAVARRRVRVVHGESQVTTAVDAPALEALCAAASARIGIRGHAVWQVLVDADGEPHIVECNCRIGGASSLSIAMGLDSFFWMLCEAAGEDLESHPFTRSEINLTQTRITCDVIEADPGL